MPDARPEITHKRRISSIWLVPIVALVLGLWMVIFTIQNQGPEITIVFSTAEGIEADKTKVMLRNVQIGLVESAGLGKDLESVVVKARIEKDAESLLREDTKFWVVRPRIGKRGISGLSTMLSGGYIQLAPGTSEKRGRDFIGLEQPPVTPAGTPGLKVVLEAERAGSVGVEDPILYKGFEVGWVETEGFNVETQTMQYGVFIGAPYDDLVTTATRFWNVSGISFSAGADGIEASTGSLDTLLMGGLEFGLPRGITPGAPVEAGAQFQLYESYADVNEQPYRYGLEYVVTFPQSVRGLQPGAPVEYRGLQSGHVERIMLDEMIRAGRPGERDEIPVLIRLVPARLQIPDTEAGVEELHAIIEGSVGRGLRASLATGNILTGGLYISFDMLEDAPEAKVGDYMGYPTIPTIASGLSGIEQRMTRLLDKVNDLPLDQTLTELQGTLASLNEVMASDATQSLPVSIDNTLHELQQTLASFSEESELQARLLSTTTELDHTLASLRQVLETLSEQPNALIFNRTRRDDPEPLAGDSQ